MSSAESKVSEKDRDLPVEAIRGRFASLPRLAYLNSGSYGLLADSVSAAVEEYLARRVETGADWEGWIQRASELTGALARRVGASADEIALTTSASSGINAVASALSFDGPRNRVLVSNYEFPTSGQIWHAQGPRGAVVEHVGEDGQGRLPLERFERMIDERTSIVALSRICYRHGGKLLDDEIRAIAAMAHRHGALVILDCFQSLGAETLDVAALDVDFAVGGTYKYLLGSAGVGYLYVRRALIGTLVPTVSGWFAQADIAAMDIFSNEPSSTASRFQAGTPPVLPCYASHAGLGVLDEHDPGAVEAHVHALVGAARAQLVDLGCRVSTPAAAYGPMIAIASPDAGALVRRLALRGIVTSHRDGNVRAGFHFYNDASDLDRLIGALGEERALLA